MIKQVSHLHYAAPALGDSRYLNVLALSCSIGCVRHWYTAIRPNGLYSAGSPNSQRKWSPGAARLRAEGNEWTDVRGEWGSVLTHTLLSWSTAAALILPSSNMLSSLGPTLQWLVPPSLSDSILSCLLHPQPLPPTLPFFITLDCSAILTIFPSLEWYTASPFLQFSFYNSHLSLFFLFPLLYSVCLLVSTPNPLSLFRPLSLSSSGQGNDYAKQESDPSMCHRLVPQVPSEGLPPAPPPPSLALLRPTNRQCISMAENSGETRHAFADNKDNWNSPWFNFVLICCCLAVMQRHIWDQVRIGLTETKKRERMWNCHMTLPLRQLYIYVKQRASQCCSQPKEEVHVDTKKQSGRKPWTSYLFFFPRVF